MRQNFGPNMAQALVSDHLQQAFKGGSTVFIFITFAGVSGIILDSTTTKAVRQMS